MSNMERLRMRIVIAEDEGITRQWLSKSIELFQENFYVCGAFPNGLEALEYCLAHDVDLLITDIRMPVMDGLTMIEQLKDQKPQVQVIVLSAYDQFAYARQAMRLGVTEFILKPEITRQSLAECLKRIRDNQKSQECAQKDVNHSSVLTARQKSYLTKLIECKNEQTELSLQDEISEYSIKLAEKHLFIVVFQWHCEEQKALDILSLLIQSTLPAGICFCYREDTYMIIGNGFFEDATQFCNDLFVLIQTHTDRPVYMGFSRVKSGYGQLHDLFRQAMTALDFCIFFSIHGWRCYEQLSQNVIQSNTDALLLEENREIQLQIQSSAYEEASKSICKLMEQIEGDQIFPPSVVRSLVIECLAMFIQKLRSHELTKEEVVFATSISLSEASEKQTLDELMSWWKTLVQEIIIILRSKDKFYSAAVQDIIVYVSKNYAKHIELSDLAERVHLNRSYISTLFKKETGELLSDYILKVRIDKACHLLKFSNLNITSISEHTGFTDITYFSRMFKKLKGITPSAFREKDHLGVK